jgi:hypothetical protein
MATNPARQTVAQMARLHLSPVGTIAPADAVAALAAAWLEVGLFTPDSLTFATDPSFNEVNSHQSNYPTRRIQESDSATVSVDLQEWSGENFRSVYGGGTVTMLTAGNYKFVPPALGARQEFSAIITIQDNAKHYRYVVPRCMQIEGVEQALQKGEEARLPLRLAVLGGDVGDAWYLLTDDPAFAPAAP